MYIELLVTLLVATLASAFMAWVIGAGSSGATPFAPAVGANAISIMRAGLVVGILGFAGATLQGASVTEAVGTGLIEGVTLPASAVIVGLLTAAGLMAVGIYTGYPIATAFTVTGALVGAGLAIGGAPAWPKYRQIAALWILAPILVGTSAYGLAKVLPRPDVPEQVSVPALAGLVGAVISNVAFAGLGPAGKSWSVADLAAASLTASPPLSRTAATLSVAAGVALLVGLDVRRDETGALRHFLLALGALVAFSAGATQVGLAVGPLVPLLADFSIPLWVVLVGGGLGMLIGSWTGAPRMIKSISQDYSSLGPRRSIAALVPSFVLAQAAVVLGVPVSFNEIIVSAIVGSGTAVGHGISRKKLARTVAAWFGSFALSFAIGYGVLWLLGQVG